MNKILTTIIVLFSLIALGQNDEGKQINYLTGSSQIGGYTVVTKTMNISSYTFTSSSVRAPILQVYVCDKSKFVGGILEDEKGKKTTILNLRLVEFGKELKFEVIGKDFTKYLLVDDGEMLQEEKNFSTFYMSGVGIWKIYKKVLQK